MLNTLINQIREQMRIGRFKRNLRQAELEQIRNRHHRRHKNKIANVKTLER